MFEYNDTTSANAHSSSVTGIPNAGERFGRTPCTSRDPRPHLYDVINDHGVVLMLSVTQRKAYRTITVRQSASEVAPHWRGNMQVVPAQRGPELISIDVDVVRIRGRLAVWCYIKHFILSELTVATLFDRLRLRLEAAILEAATRDWDQLPLARPLAIQIEINAVDPAMSLVVYDPLSAAKDASKALGRLESNLEQLVSAHRACGMLSGGATGPRARRRANHAG